MATPRAKEDTLHAVLRDTERLLAIGTKEFERWWVKQQPRTKLGVVIVALLGAILVVNMFLGAVGRITSRPVAVQTAAQTTTTSARPGVTALAVELAPNDAGKTWAVSRVWQGHGPFQSGEFTVTE